MRIRWQPIVKAKSSVLFQWYVAEGHKESYFRSSLGLRIGLENHKIVSDEIFADRNEWIKLERVLTSKVKSEQNFFAKFIELCYQHSDKLIKVSKQINRMGSWRKLSNDRLLFLYRKYQNAVLNLMPFMNGILVLDGVLRKEIVGLFEIDLKIEDEKEQNLLLSKLIIPNKKSFFIKETEDLLATALKLQKNKSATAKRDIQECLRKYVWMSSIAYLNPFQTYKDVARKVENLLRENPKEKLAKIKQTRTKTLKDYKEAYSQIKRSRKLVRLIDLAQEFIYLQTYRFDVFSIAHYYAYPLLEEIGRRFDLKIEELVYLTGEEIINLFEDKAKIDKKEINDRISNYALVKEGNKYTLLSGDRVRGIARKVVREAKVKGTVASRGRATGRVKLLFDVGDIPKVNKGDIIVSPMTHPKLVPAIIKAAGIITDFGGMLCHAAIVSREFGIPCIVGTKNATKVFRDGDLVELNAYDGAARKL